MMKRGKLFIGLILILILFSCSIEARQTIITKEQSFRIDFVKYDPSPLVPGQASDLWFEIVNLKGQPLENLQIILVDVYPFKAENTVINIPTLMPGETKAFSFKVTPNADSPAGNYMVSLQFLSPVLGEYNSEQIPLVVMNQPKILTLTDITRTPETAVPGGNVNVDFTLTNTFDSTLKDIVVKLDLSNTSYFAPATTTTEADLKELAAGDKQKVTFNLLISPNAPADVYKIPVSITYTDESGNSASKETYIGVPVNTVPVYSLYLEDSTAYEKDKAGKVTLSVSNVGPVDIKYLTIRLLESDGYDIISKSQIYIGNLKPDDYQTAEFNIYRKTAGPLKAMMTYKDAYNNEYSKVEDIQLQFLKTNEAEKYGLITTTSYLSTILLVIVAILFIWMIYEWITHKSLKKAVNYVLIGSILTVADFIMFFRPRNLRQRYREVREHIKGPAPKQ